MATRILKVTSPTDPNLKLAVAAIRAGKLVGFPTETVYGLGADATNPVALHKVFEAKNRPPDNPLIVHIASWPQFKEVAQVSPIAQKLAKAFWPGPLTLLLPKQKLISPVATADSVYVAVRWPSHSIAQALIQEAKLPIAAPSANRSGSPSPTEASHVEADLKGMVEIILDAGPSEIGLESTFIDVRNPDNLTILRPGAITAADIKRKTGLVVHAARGADLITPGTKYNHYQPKTPVILFTDISKLNSYLRDHPKKKLGYFGIKEVATFFPFQVVAHDTKDFAHLLYKTFRDADGARVDELLVLSPITTTSHAVWDRLTKAASRII